MSRTSLLLILFLLSVQALSQGLGPLVPHADHRSALGHRADAAHVHVSRGLPVGHSHAHEGPALKRQDGGPAWGSLGLPTDHDRGHDSDAVYLSASGVAPLATGTSVDHRSRIVSSAAHWGLLIALAEEPTHGGRARSSSPPGAGSSTGPIYLQTRSLLI